MPEQSLKGSRILIVEDEYLLADDLCNSLESVGADVLGPIGTVEEATAFVGQEGRIDAAVLDVNLRGNMVFPVADALRARGVPFAFTTGYDEWALPDRFADTPRLEKPFKGPKIAAILFQLVTA